MCWKVIRGWFHKEEKPWQPPHPEEPPNPALSITAQELLTDWFTAYLIPGKHRPFWYDIDLTITSNLQNADAAEETIAQLKQIKIRPPWANPGVLSHAAAHVVYDLLTPQQRADFRTIYNEELATRDSLVQRLYAIKQYMKTSVVEAHGECFRYLGEKLPLNLRLFYPKLF